MYNCLGEYQVKCFYIPILNEEKKVTIMEGMLFYYGIGDDVPYKTDYYDYTENFLIVGKHIHVIKEGKYKNSYAIDELPKDLFRGIKTVISNGGEKLKIKSISELLDYLNEEKGFKDKYINMYNKCFEEYNRKYEKFSHNYLNSLSDLERKDAIELRVKSLKECNDKSAKLYLEFNKKWKYRINKKQQYLKNLEYAKNNTI